MNIDYFRILFAAFFTPWGLHEHGEIDWGARLLLHGPPGSRKTAIMRQLAFVLGIFFYSLKPGAKGQGGFGVTPVPIEIEGSDGKKYMILSFPGPDWVANQRGKPMLVLVDEMNTAAPALQAPLLGLTQEKEIGSDHLDPRHRVFGATNSVEDAAGGWDLAPAIANRLGHIDWPDPPVDEWAEYMIRGAVNDERDPVDIEAEEERVLQAWPHAWAAATGIITSYVKANRSIFRDQPPKHDNRSSRAWASPRTWEYAIRMLATSTIHKLNEEETDLLLGAYVGDKVAAELGTFRNQKDLVDPAQLLEGEVQFKHDPFRLDRTAVTINSCAALVSPQQAENRDKRGKALWILLGKLMEDVEDLVVPVASTLFKSGLSGPKEATPILAEIKPTLMATEKA